MIVPSYSIGIEEEYFIVDRQTRNLRTRMPKPFFHACKQRLKDRIITEMLQSQIEATTSPCQTIAQAAEQVQYIRRTLSETAADHSIGIMAAATHPLAIWREQKPTAEDRYQRITSDIQLPGRRSLLCGMHVHVELPDPDRRVDVMIRAIPYLPIFLALSTSSPFWHGYPTGLAGYRLAAHEEMPRTGLPELLRGTGAFDAYVSAMVEAGAIPDASYIWWDIRPSAHHPTLELRIPDVCTRIEDGISIAALYRCLVRYLFENPEVNCELDGIDRCLAEENKWRAQRYGTRAEFIDRTSRTAKNMEAVVAELLEILRPDAEALDCLDEVEHVRTIVERGSSAGEQMTSYARQRKSGRNRLEALRFVIDELVRITSEPYEHDPEIPLPELPSAGMS